MRIISGKYKGRKFYPPKNIPTRPTTDFAKEGLFNIIENNFDIEKVKFLDLFSGTGSISYEFASRGCEDITSVERFPRCAAFIKETSELLGMEGLNVFREDVLKFIEHATAVYDIIFAGPPYAFNKIEQLPSLIIEKGLLRNEGWFILEHSPRNDFKEHPYLIHIRKYGNTFFSIFSTKESQS